MPIEGLAQPDMIPVDGDLRLRKFDGVYDFALEWYDSETTLLVDGDPEPYTPYALRCMYEWQNEHGELYFIEYDYGNGFVPVGDVTFSGDDLPIVIGPKDLRGKGIGKRVVRALIERARQLGYTELHVKDIYSFNEGSRRCFTGCGFVEDGTTEKGNSFVLKL